VSKSISRVALPKLATEWVSTVIKPAIEPFECSKQGANDNKLYVKDTIAVGDVDHVFSHIKKTYRVQWIILEGGQGPPELATELYVLNQALPDSESSVTKGAIWCSLNEVSEAKLVNSPQHTISQISHANFSIGTGVMKIWKLVKEKWEKSGT
jgi:A/G-specific adenine glycosylase